MIRPYDMIRQYDLGANEFAGMIRQYDMGRIAANEFADMIRPYCFGANSGE
jgi:hypothetical protein